MFLCELNNHEYSYTGEVDEALDALGITPTASDGHAPAAAWAGTGMHRSHAARLFRLMFYPEVKNT